MCRVCGCCGGDRVVMDKLNTYIYVALTVFRHSHYEYYKPFIVSTHALDPCLWGKSDHPAFGPPAS